MFRHPQRVAKLVLLSPAGVLGAPESADPAREAVDDQRSVTVNSSGGATTGASGAQTANGAVEGANRSTVSLPEPRTSERAQAAYAEQRAKREREPLARKVLTYL